MAWFAAEIGKLVDWWNEEEKKTVVESTNKSSFIGCERGGRWR